MSDSDFTIFKLKVGRASLDFVSLLLLILNYILNKVNAPKVEPIALPNLPSC